MIPSTSNVPFWESSKLKIMSAVVVLPLPVAPTSPTVVLAGMIRLISFKAVRDAFVLCYERSCVFLANIQLGLEGCFRNESSDTTSAVLIFFVSSISFLFLFSIEAITSDNSDVLFSSLALN